MAANALAPLAYHLQEGLRTFNLNSWMRSFDIENFIKGADLKALGSVALVVVAVIFLANLLFKGNGPLGKSMAVSAADAWQMSRQQPMRFDKFGRQNRSLEPAIEILDAVADAVKKWEASGDLALDQSFNAGLHHW